MKKNCYLYVDSRLPINEQKMSVMCEDCHKTHNFGSFWSADRGYGNWLINCKLCNAIIFDEVENDKTDI